MANAMEKQSKSDVTNFQPPRGMNVFNDLEKMFENFSPRGWLRPFHWDWPFTDEMQKTLATAIPDVDVIERDGEIIVKATMPGVEKKDIDVSITRDRVTIKGKTHHEEKEEKGDYYRSEIRKGSYMRTLSLPAYVDENKSKAKYKDGVLELTLHKLEESHRKNIKVE